MRAYVSPRQRIGVALRVGGRVLAAAGLLIALWTPAEAQFWSSWGRPTPPQGIPQPQFNPFNWFRSAPRKPPRPQREAPVDHSHAPPTRKADVKDEAKITTKIVVMGDGMADWLAYGLEDAFSEQPEVGIVRKNRTYSGLIRYDARNDTDWPQVAKKIIAAEHPKYIVMMIGVNDRQAIREEPRASRSKERRKNTKDAKDSKDEQSASKDDEDKPLDLETLARESAAKQNAEIEAKADAAEAAKEKREQEKSGRDRRQAKGPLEFRSEEWEAAYIKRIDATIAALMSAGVPVFWVGLPAQRSSRATSDSAYLNDLYRQRAEKAGIVYVDIWDGFVDEAGRYSSQGPDYEGQIRRLRSGDGIYFTKAGARKLAHYVEREIQRSMTNRAVPVALPVAPAPGGHSAGPRPMAGPVLPLTVSTGGGNELLGGSRPRRAPSPDPVTTRVLVKGEPIPPESGRADDFSWPRGSKPAATAAPKSDTPPASATAPAADADRKDEDKQVESSKATDKEASREAPATQPARASTPKHSAPKTSAGHRNEIEAQQQQPQQSQRKKPVRKRPAEAPPRPPLSIGPSSWFR
jgi:hypothetical protein